MKIQQSEKGVLWYVLDEEKEIIFVCWNRDVAESYILSRNVYIK